MVCTLHVFTFVLHSSKEIGNLRTSIDQEVEAKSKAEQQVEEVWGQVYSASYDYCHMCLLYDLCSLCFTEGEGATASE